MHASHRRSWTRKELRMAPGNVCESQESRIDSLEQDRQQLLEALKTLFDLLEEYAPAWYTEDHHRQALSALRSSR